METGFKILFLLGVFLYSVIVVGIFLLIIRILLVFYPELQFMGFTIS